jgi:HNH endonuclease
MSRFISDKIKERVAQRAEFCCEYCLLSEKVSFYTFHIDHIRSIKHGGSSLIQNLAYCCPDCNHFKGSDVGSFIDNGDSLIRFFDPRKDKWHDHFEMNNGEILGKTPIGTVTERIFKFNDLDRLIFRRQLISISRYP